MLNIRTATLEEGMYVRKPGDPEAFCTDCETELKLSDLDANHRCPCGSGRVIVAKPETKE